MLTTETQRHGGLRERRPSAGVSRADPAPTPRGARFTWACSLRVSVSLWLVLVCVLRPLPASTQSQNTHVAVIVGLAGEAGARRDLPPLGSDTGRSCLRPTRRFRASASSISSRSPSRTRSGRQADPVKRKSKKPWSVSATAAGEADIVFIVLIGHGTFDGKIAKFNLPGPT